MTRIESIKQRLAAATPDEDMMVWPVRLTEGEIRIVLGALSRDCERSVPRKMDWYKSATDKFSLVLDLMQEWNLRDVFVLDTQEMAIVLGRRGGSKGGFARAHALTPERRREIAVKAAKIRWAKDSPVGDEGTERG